MHGELTEKIEALIAPFIEELSAELVELNMRQSNKTTVIDVIADKPDGGITIDEIIYINKQAVAAIEEKQWFGENFVVEVSSPGLDRVLKTSKDFTRARGRKVRVHLLDPIEGKIEHHGEIIEIKENKVLIQSKKQLVTIPLEIIS